MSCVCDIDSFALQRSNIKNIYLQIATIKHKDIFLTCKQLIGKIFSTKKNYRMELFDTIKFSKRKICFKSIDYRPNNRKFDWKHPVHGLQLC